MTDAPRMTKPGTFDGGYRAAGTLPLDQQRAAE